MVTDGKISEAAKEQNGKANNGNSGIAVPDAPDDTAFLRLPTTMVMLTKDSEKDGRQYEGSVRIRYGSQKGQWVVISYTESLKIVSFLKENKDLVNAQLDLEERRNSVGRL